MGYLIKWKSKTREGTTFVPTPKRGWVHSPQKAKEWFGRTKGQSSINNAPKKARIVHVRKGGSYKQERSHKRT